MESRDEGLDQEVHDGLRRTGAMQGSALTPEEIRRIVTLLTDTQMTMPEIAARMHCSRSAVVAINRKFKVRDYRGQRATWELVRLHSDPAVSESISAA